MGPRSAGSTAVVAGGLRGARWLLVPFVAWQAYVAHVRASQEYAHPAYEYQRAPYQYYNVSYAENLFLVDPFRPELGSMNASTLATRMIANVPSLLVAVGETVSTRKGYWERVLIGPQERLLGRTVIPKNLVLIPILLLTAVVGVGIAVLVRRKAWLMVFIVLGSLGLTCMTPWPAQFTRYLSGMAPFLTICALLGFSVMHTALADRRFGITALRLAATALLALAFVMEAFSATKMFRERWSDEAKTVASKSDQTGSPLFFHDRTWQRWEETAAWVGAHASPDAIVATSAPHFFYLRTGLRAILPPMEADPARARRLLEMVPASYVIVDELEFVDISRRYARPAVEGDPTHWRVVYSKAGTKTYQHVVSAECVQENVIFDPARNLPLLSSQFSFCSRKNHPKHPLPKIALRLSQPWRSVSAIATITGGSTIQLSTIDCFGGPRLSDTRSISCRARRFLNLVAAKLRLTRALLRVSRGENPITAVTFQSSAPDSAAWIRKSSLCSCLNLPGPLAGPPFRLHRCHGLVRPQQLIGTSSDRPRAARSR